MIVIIEEEKPVDVSTLKLTDDPLCNSEDLRALMLENIDDNLNSSKRLIQLAAEAQYGGRSVSTFSFSHLIFDLFSDSMLSVPMEISPTSRILNCSVRNRKEMCHVTHIDNYKITLTHISP